MANDNHRYYIHFENMPPYERLDMLFEMAVAKEKIFASSYHFEVPKTIPPSIVFDKAKEVFKRRPFYICREHTRHFFGETDVNSADPFPQ